MQDNSLTEQDIQTLTNGAILNLATLPAKNLNIRANTSPATVGRVVFALTGAQVRNHSEAGKPYALFGDNNGNYNIWIPPPGNYTLNGTPFTTSIGGTAGTPLTISFSVINQVSGNKVVSFTLVNASTEKDIQTLANGATLNLATLPAKNLNIRANTSPATVGRVVLALTGAQVQNRSEAGKPYALFGDNNGNYNIWVPPVGNYTLKGTPFTTSTGGTAGTALTISFRVINAAPLTTSLSLESSNLSVKPATLVWPNPAAGVVNIKLDNYKSRVTMQLIDRNGAGIKEWRFYPSLKRNTYRLNVGNLAQGLYLVRITDDKGNTKTEKIVIGR